MCVCVWVDVIRVFWGIRFSCVMFDLRIHAYTYLCIYEHQNRTHCIIIIIIGIHTSNPILNNCRTLHHRRNLVLTMRWLVLSIYICFYYEAIVHRLNLYLSIWVHVHMCRNRKHIFSNLDIHLLTWWLIIIIAFWRSIISCKIKLISP